MSVIWDTQRHHLSCIQDPPGVQLYTQTGSVTKGGLTLPVYRCARGSTSLESFHNHLNCFIPGTSTNLEIFQAYLLEVAHYSTASMSSASVFLAVVLCKTTLSQDSTQLIGVEYLCSQQSWEFRENFGQDPDAPDGIPADLGDIEDEGFGDEAEEQDHTISPLFQPRKLYACLVIHRHPLIPPRACHLSCRKMYVCRRPDGTPGFDRVVDLARYLVELREKPCISDREAADIVRLWDRLPDTDSVSYPLRHKERLLQGRFKATHSKTSTCHGKESLKRLVNICTCMLARVRPAQWPNIIEIVEAVCLDSAPFIQQEKVKGGVSMNRLAPLYTITSRIRKTGGNAQHSEDTKIISFECQS
ncbi:hypothetical protein QQF64_031690 [Cirrhinus molitorella]|uniref:Uncharacterized protein n=1 Tax=Cirrhinus molitorella TaxID=172907 RepID=A0ABR3MXU2_9TELE